MQEILAKFDSTFSGVLAVVSGDLATVKTGRAKPDLIANVNIKVSSYGSVMKLQELANLAAPDTQTLTITPWDNNIIEDIQKGLQQSDLQLQPIIDGDLIRINIPTLTQERRQELAKLVEKKVEAGKMLLREERKRLKREIDEMKGKPDVSEDDIFQAVEELDNKTREWTEKIDQAGEDKKQEVLTL